MLLQPRYCRWACPDEGRDKDRKSIVYLPALLRRSSAKAQQVPRLAYIRPAGVRHCGRSEAQLSSDMSMGLCSAASIAESPLLGERIGLN